MESPADVSYVRMDLFDDGIADFHPLYTSISLFNSMIGFLLFCFDRGVFQHDVLVVDIDFFG